MSLSPDPDLPLSRLATAVAMPRAPYLDDLNPAQRAAVEALDGPVLMLAGAGTGKTKALTARIAHLLTTGRARPNEILAVTFTNKAAREMRNRVGGMVGQAVEGMPWLGTFHAVSVKLLRRHAELVGLRSNFTILDTDDQVRLLKQLILAAGIDEKRWPARTMAHIIDGWKNRAVSPDNIPAADVSAFDHKGVDLYAAYQARLRDLNASTSATCSCTASASSASTRTCWSSTSAGSATSSWTSTRTPTSRSTCGCGCWRRAPERLLRGDDDQSIYGWRGAEVGNILRFETDFPARR
jgi:DNA helicase-2/ATP-dependent DNA helicase PcrA